MSFLETIEADAPAFLTWLSTWASNRHERTNDVGLAAVARLATKTGAALTAILTAPENAADIAAVKAMIAQDLPSLTAPAKAAAPETPDPPSSVQHTQSPGDFNRWQAEHPPS